MEEVRSMGWGRSLGWEAGEGHEHGRGQSDRDLGGKVAWKRAEVWEGQGHGRA